MIHHCINVPYAEWEATLPIVMERLIEGAGSAGATLVYCDNLYMYGPVEGPIRESSPTAEATPKGRLRKKLADMLFEADAAGRVKFEEPFVLDDGKFTAAFPDFAVTSVREGIERSLEWETRRAARSE